MSLGRSYHKEESPKRKTAQKEKKDYEVDYEVQGSVSLARAVLSLTKLETL